jgi:penicillin-binding protein 1C
MTRRRSFRPRIVVVAIAALAPLLLAAWVRLGPLPGHLLAAQDDVSTVVVDRNGTPLYEARSGRGMRAARLDADALPPPLAHATIAAEDRRFRSHAGIDPVAMVRAMVRNVRAGRVVEGASTITQQVAKLLLQARDERPRSRSVFAKLQEAVVALRLEHRLDKDEILALYLNLAPYGNQLTGAARASEVYFGVPPSQLTIAQAAFLAGLPQRPSAYNPYRGAAGARGAVARQRYIIDAMLGARAITRDEASTALAERLRFDPQRADFVAPHFVEMVLATPDARRRSRVQTTLDATLQREVTGIVEAHRADLERHGAHNVAVVVLANDSGEWLAWEGSGNYADTDHGGTINGASALRQPGSALKPFTYALAFENGDTPATVLPDIAASYPTAVEGVVYTPRNYDGSFHGPLRARTALAGSQNVPAVALAARLGVPDLLRFLRALGFTSFDRTASHYGLGVSLGNAEVTLAELVNAYAALARGGMWMAPRAILDAADDRPSRRVLSRRAAFWVTDILADDEARAYVFGRGGSLEFPFTVAAKTGTSQAYRDNWTIGYTREVTVGVWVGNFDRDALVGSSGVTGAGPIFHAVMLAAQQHVRGRDALDEPIVERPADLHEHTICGLSGMRAGAACPLRTREWLPAGVSLLPCDWHHDSEDGLLTLWPVAYREWAAANRLLDDGDGALVKARDTRVATVTAGKTTGARADFGILSPADGATYLIDPTLRPDFQRMPLRAVGARGRVEWRVDGQLVSGRDSGDAEWTLERGVHRVTARDASGQATAEAQITVK